MTIRTLVFDFGNVVGFFSRRRAAEQMAAYSALDADALLAFLDAGELEDDYESGRLTTAALMEAVRDRCRLTCTDEEFRLAFADMFHPNPEVCELIPRLKPHYRLLLLSNTNELHCDHFSQQFADTLHWFDHLVYTHRVGVRKPSSRIYAHCVELAGCRAGECLFIDDLPANVAAARACGWQGLVYRPGDGLAAGLAALGVAWSSPTPRSGKELP
jgi:putative hydrolase of the HAD superfamily